MTTLKFSDGEEFDTSGQLRVIRRNDGLYVIGQGMLCAVGTRKEAAELIRDLKRRLPEQGGGK